MDRARTARGGTSPRRLGGADDVLPGLPERAPACHLGSVLDRRGARRSEPLTVQWVETTGRTVEEAKELALDQLGVDEGDAEFEVLEEPKTGLFGRLRSEARVRARVRPTRPRAKEERRGRRRGRSADPAGETDAATPSETASAATGPTAPPSPKANIKARQRGRPDTDHTEESNEMNEDVAIAEQGEAARVFVTGLLERFGADGSVAVNEVDDDTVEVAVSGGDLGLLIGPRGTTLAALQEITRTVVQRQTGARNGRVLVDVSGYRQRRRDALERFTRQVATEVIDSGESRALEPMSPADRKIVHDTANEIPGVRTASEGEEPRRRVIVLPEES